MQSEAELRSLLSRIDHRGYPAYKDTKGQYRFPGYVLSIDHVQGDPFASPSKVSVLVSGKTAGFPPGIILWKMSENCTSGRIAAPVWKKGGTVCIQGKRFR